MLYNRLAAGAGNVNDNDMRVRQETEPSTEPCIPRAGQGYLPIASP